MEAATSTERKGNVSTTSTGVSISDYQCVSLHATLIGRYSVAMQVVCDNDKQNIAAHCGCPGSCAKAYVFKRMGIYRNSGFFFSRGDYLLADSAYPSLCTVLPVYKQPLADDPDNTDLSFYLV
jgi:hypothetical protein